MYVVCVCIHAYTCVRVSSHVRLRVAAFQTRSLDPNPVTGDPDPIRIGTRYGLDTLAIQRLT